MSNASLNELLAALQNNPADRELRAILADALEEAGQLAEAAHLRGSKPLFFHRGKLFLPRKATMERTLRTQETSNTGLPSSYKYARKCLRVVECRKDQQGWLSEKGVVVHYESEHFAAFSRGPRSNYRRILAQAEQVREETLRQILGV